MRRIEGKSENKKKPYANPFLVMHPKSSSIPESSLNRCDNQNGGFVTSSLSYPLPGH
jgi:hypothetical protein